ncbi:MAG: hypothetical protein HXX19_06895 [Rhodoferax sp.]|nr:hypothetical protein [Rhodoferax sp.]
MRSSATTVLTRFKSVICSHKAFHANDRSRGKHAVYDRLLTGTQMDFPQPAIREGLFALHSCLSLFQPFPLTAQRLIQFFD